MVYLILATNGANEHEFFLMGEWGWGNGHVRHIKLRSWLIGCRDRSFPFISVRIDMLI